MHNAHTMPKWLSSRQWGIFHLQRPGYDYMHWADTPSVAVRVAKECIIFLQYTFLYSATFFRFRCTCMYVHGHRCGCSGYTDGCIYHLTIQQKLYLNMLSVLSVYTKSVCHWCKNHWRTGTSWCSSCCLVPWLPIQNHNEQFEKHQSIWDTRLILIPIDFVY